ncbi:response regulator receiver sensor signal transduction histidine kinase [Candidatus Vecturithrix granuli]|uniref:histidine kinase n=1 Tax=Vecturithrix granuli TaxID=1499967 RepID=A0A081C0B4_VECG1|nr:response regulator receiver sensor signal transduction histidine kinase [Candidatus Vecturithrix granuli]
MPNILVIEDEQHLRATIVQTLEFEGFKTFSAANGRLGVQLAQEHRPDLILCDILMPELDGYGVLAEIRNDPRTATIPFIFLTSKTTRQELRQGMNRGADDYLTKPFEVEDLLSAIRARLEKRQTLSEYTTKQIEDLRLHLSSSLPHEFRTPLHEISAEAQYLKAFSADLARKPEKIFEIGQVLEQGVHRLERLVENYLLYTDLTLTKYIPGRTERYAEKELIESKTVIAYMAKRRAEESARQKDLCLEVQEAPLCISTQGFCKILDEVLDNAFKFSESGAPVRVESRTEGNHVMISISDQGRGMSQEQLERIGAYIQFERVTYEQQGMGLGLCIARLLTELYGGKLNITSQQGQGTTVQLILDNKTRATTD